MTDKTDSPPPAPPPYKSPPYICKRCSAAIQFDDAFCSHCGTRSACPPAYMPRLNAMHAPPRAEDDQQILLARALVLIARSQLMTGGLIEKLKGKIDERDDVMDSMTNELRDTGRWLLALGEYIASGEHPR